MPDDDREPCEACQGSRGIWGWGMLLFPCEWCHGTGHEPQTNLIVEVLSAYWAYCTGD